MRKPNKLFFEIFIFIKITTLSNINIFKISRLTMQHMSICHMVSEA